MSACSLPTKGLPSGKLLVGTFLSSGALKHTYPCHWTLKALSGDKPDLGKVVNICPQWFGKGLEEGNTAAAAFGGGPGQSLG